MTEGQKQYQFNLKMAAWQKRKLEIFQRDDFSCIECHRSGTVILNVHHKVYGFNKMPWEYDDNELETLCASCHKKKHYGSGVLFGPKIDRRPEAVKMIDRQVLEYMNKLKVTYDHSITEEILKSIMFLKNERKLLIKY